MKPLLTFFFTLCVVAATAQSKTKAKPASARPKMVAKAPRTIPSPKEERPVIELIVSQDEGQYYWPVFRGDTLVYEVVAPGATYQFAVMPQRFSEEQGIDFHYTMTNAENTSGKVHISPAAYRSSKAYNNYFTGGYLQLTRASTVWMCYDNFMDMPERKTLMQLDGNAPEYFYRPQSDEVMVDVDWNGKPVKIEGFVINNAENGGGNKTLWIHNISANPLILKMELGWTIQLKAVRSLKR